MNFLDDLEREIERVAYTAEPAPARRRWWRRSGVLLVLLPLFLGTVAVAATTGIIFGEPVKQPPGVKPDPKAGVGVNDGAGKLFDLRVADPGGGPDWGVRLVKTSRSLGCMQAGRVVDGKLGVLGQDGAFGNDGKFHELPAEVLEHTFCQQSDGAGNVFIAVTSIGLPASNDGTGCRPRASRGKQDACPPGSLRDVFFGLLGPEATAITYREGGKRLRQAVSGPEGAYLVVRATDPNRRNVGWWSPSLSPSWVETIEFRDGSTCRVEDQKRRAGVRRCPLKGYVKPKLDLATRADLATPIDVHVGTKPEIPKGMSPEDAARGPKQRAVTVRFRARRPSDAKSFYTYEAKFDARPREGCSYSMGGSVARDMPEATMVTETLYVGFRCRGTLTIRVGYAQQDSPTMMPFHADGRPNAKVGTAVVKVG